VDITFADLLTAAGTGVAAAIITALISVLRTSIPAVANIHGALLAFVLSAILYVLAAIATSAFTLDTGLAVFLAWLTCATAAVGVHETITKPTVSRISNGK
jgi:hypothetical protein